IGLQPGDIHLNISSPGWAKHAWSCIFAPWNAQACVFIYNSNRFSATGLLEVLQKYGVTTLCAPPTVWRMLIQANLADYRIRLREVVGAGEPLNPEVLLQVRAAWGITIRDGFGQTETTCQIGNPPGQAVKDGSMGRPLPGYRISLRNAEGKEASEGEICLSLAKRPAGLMLGYFEADELTAKVMHDGFYHTGDIGQLDADGYITHVGRADDVFKSADYRISPFELESVLIEHPSIVEAAIVPSPDPLRLCVPKAYVTLAANLQPGPELARDVLAFCRERLAPYKRIRRIEFSELPKTISGKIRRNDLRKQEEQQRGSGTRAQWEFFEEDFQPGTKNG
ncbi:MAG: AMP-binding protein, partial [Solimonas sp.]